MKGVKEYMTHIVGGASRAHGSLFSVLLHSQLLMGERLVLFSFHLDARCDTMSH